MSNTACLTHNIFLCFAVLHIATTETSTLFFVDLFEVKNICSRLDNEHRSYQDVSYFLKLSFLCLNNPAARHIFYLQLLFYKSALNW